ncbi:MAG: hypothetical protein RR277_09165, partial [Rikenellaceae bacterium]
MMRKITIIIVLLTLLATSCKKEPMTFSSPVQIDLSLRAAIGETINRVKISTLRLIAVQGNDIVFNRTVADGGLTESVTKEINFDIPAGQYSFYAVINEVGDLSRITTLVDLLRLHVPSAITVDDATGTAEQKLCLFGSRDGVVIRKRYDNSLQVSQDGGTTWQQNLSIDMERVAIKLGLLFKTEPGVTAKV